MAIAVQCPECHKKYNAPDHLAGRRVKCKYCGIAFLIAADSRTSDADFNVEDLNALSALGETGHRPTPAAAKGAGEEDVDSLFQADYPREGAPRTNKLYVFPMSRLLDQWLPPVLLVIGLVWMCREAFKHNETDHLWVGFFRAGMFLLAFFASVFPFTLMGVRAAGRKLNFDMPPNPALRVLGVYAVPFALACALWLIYGEVSGLLFGVLLGVVVALPLLFLLFRLLPVEAPITFGYAAGSFLLSVVVAVAGLVALNLMLVGILRSLRTEHDLAASPFGPGFKWDAPPGKAPQYAKDPQPDGPTTTEADPQATQPTTDSATQPATTVPSERIRFGATQPVGGRTVPTTRTAGDGPAPGGTDQAATDGTVVPLPGAEPATGGPAKQPPRSGIVADVRTLAEGDILQVITPVVPGPWVALVRGGDGGTEDRVERWNADKWQKEGEARLPRDPQGNRYVLSPDGAYLAFLSDFPALSVQVWSFADGKLMRPVRLVRDNTAPHREQRTPVLVGFSTREQVVLHWYGPFRESILEVLNVNAPPARPRAIHVVAFDHNSASFAVSPDGQTFAVVSRGSDGGDLESVSLATGKPIKQMPIVDLDWAPDVQVTALAFTPDSSKIAAVFTKGDGQGLLMCWPAAGRSSPTQFWYRLPPVQIPLGPEGTPDFTGRPLHWLEGGKSWLYYGTHVFDTAKGTRVADLGIAGVRRQWATGGDTCLLLGSNFLGEPRLDAVKLDLAQARSATGDAAGAPARSTARPVGRGPR